MGDPFSVPWKKKTSGRPAERRVGEPCARGNAMWQPDEQQVQKLVEMGFAEADVRSALQVVFGKEILAIKMLRFAECAWAGNDTKLWQPNEHQVQKLVEMGFAEAAVGSALEAVNGDEILAIKMLCFAECGPAGIDTYRKLWQPDEQQVQKHVEMGFAEAAVRSALEAVNGNEILAIKILRFADCGPAGINIYKTLWQPDEQQVQKLVEMGFAEATMRSALEAVNGDEILAIKMLRFSECARAGNDTTAKLWQPDEQQVQKLVEMGLVEDDVRGALEAVNGDEILAIKMLRFAECARVGNTNSKLWQPDEQQVQKLVEMGFTEVASRSALEVVNGDEILAVKMIRFAEFGPARINTYRKLWWPDEQQVQKLVEMGFAKAAVRSALENVNGDEILAIKMLRFAECAQVGNYTNTKLWQPDEQRVQKLVEMGFGFGFGFVEDAVRSALEAVNGDEILAVKMLRFAECARVGNDANLKLWQPDEQQVQKLVGMGFVEATTRSALEAINGDEFLAIEMLLLAELAQARNDTNTKPNEQRVQKLVEMGFVEGAVRSALEVVNGDEILAVKMLRFAECARLENDTNTELWWSDEQRVQKLVEMGFAKAAVRSALEDVNGDEILAIKMLRFAKCARAGNYINTKPDDQRVQKLVEMGFAEAAVRSALEAINGDEIMAIKTLRFAECAQAGIDTNTKLWQPDEQHVQKLVEMGCDDSAGRSALEAPVRSALEAVNGDEFLAIEMLLFAERAQARNDTNTMV